MNKHDIYNSHAAIKIKKNFKKIWFTLICHWSEFRMARKPNMLNKEYLNVAEIIVLFTEGEKKKRV